MRSYDYKMWDIGLDDPYVPMKTGMGVEALVPKLQSEWLESEVKRMQVNFKAINTLYCALNPIEFNRIFTCKSAKEIWDKLKVIHVGTSQVKESNIALLLNQYEMFKMQANVSVTSWFDRYTTILNQLNKLRRVIPEDEMVKRLLRSLPKS